MPMPALMSILIELQSLTIMSMSKRTSDAIANTNASIMASSQNTNVIYQF